MNLGNYALLFSYSFLFQMTKPEKYSGLIYGKNTINRDTLQQDAVLPEIKRYLQYCISK
jgi:hypothetical protein